MERTGKEEAFKIIAIEVNAPSDESGCNADLGCSTESLEKAVNLFSSRAKRQKSLLSVGEIRLLIKREENGRLDLAVISLTDEELFLTIPK
ncbi:MAG: hypothetical protein ABSB00_01045 [Minisyncoccia bacterium]|jgi:hypothetical protein